MKPIFAFLGFFLFLVPLQAEVKLPNLFTDHLVLQRNQPIHIWGWAKPKERVQVEFHGQQQKLRADAKGNWSVKLSPEIAGGPYTLTVKGENTLVLQDILVGDVWVCSGQSNMEWTVGQSINGAQEVAAANYPMIRHIKVIHKTSLEPLDDIEKTEWQVTNPQNVANFTAAGYFFARKVFQELNVPIGIINTSWGGTHIETWMSKETLQTNPDFIPVLEKMPPSLAAYTTIQKDNMTALITRFQSVTPANENVEAWKEPSFNDANWSSLLAPRTWEAQGLDGFDGVVWYRKEVELTPEQANSAAVLQLGTIDDCDETYVNGQKLGGVCQWDAVRKYALPQGLLKQGKNLIAVKVTDTGGGGGFHGDPAVIKMILGQTEIPLAGTWKARVADYMKKNMPDANDMPTLLFNAMLHPLLPYPIKGVLWYQGESNVPRAAQYATSFPQMITDWRARWKEGNFPFYFVQLAAYLPLNRNTLAGSTWAELRDAQRQTLALPNTCMTVTTDIGDANDIHPRNKQDVGLRLAACALKKDYNKDVVESGPVYKAMEIRGNSIELQFDSIGSGLMAKDKYGYLYGFTIAGEDQQFKWAKATIQGDKVIVSSTEVPNPVAVRFGWVDNPSETNLYNKEGFPASIFRTDTWKRLTDGVKFGN